MKILAFLTFSLLSVSCMHDGNGSSNSTDLKHGYGVDGEYQPMGSHGNICNGKKDSCCDHKDHMKHRLGSEDKEIDLPHN